MSTSEAPAGPERFSELLGFRLVHQGDHEAVMEVTPRREHANIRGAVHGGFLSTLLDSTTAWAVYDALPPGSGAPHVQISVQFLRRAVLGELLVCRARCVTAGRRIAAADGWIEQGGRLVARGATTHAVALPRPPAGADREGTASSVRPGGLG